MGILPILNRWKLPVFILTILALIISAIVSVLLPNVYKSTTVFYPTRFSSTFTDRITEGEIQEYAPSAEDIDRLITISESQPVAEYIIRKYELYKDYDFESFDDEASKQYIFDTYNSNLKIVHNERDAVELTFYSEDKIKAAAVANEIVVISDSINQQLFLENRSKLASFYKNQFNFLTNEMVSLRDSLARSRKQYGIFASEKESRYLGKAVIETQTSLVQAKGELEAMTRMAGASDPRVVALKAKIKGLENANVALQTGADGTTFNLTSYMAGVDIVNDLSNQFTTLAERYLLSKSIYESARFAETNKISTVYVVQKAYPATRKAKPIRWLIVVGATLLTFMVSVAFISLYELFIREYRRQTI
ncbi:MAG TPA: hypothetical protein VK927_05610 [Adhaeribacter sp.]|nr:hypothetical protein [Adhaeribacter sp.]